jgi:uncharacterized membrane protein
VTAADDEVAPPEDDAERGLAWWLIVSGLVGLAAAATLLIEKIALLKDPDYVPSCSMNPVLNCGSIMRTEQAEVLGFPNPIIGIAAFAVVAATGAALLAGGRLATWYWLGLQVGTVLGLGFVIWLIFQSLYRIDALCPYCMVVWAVVIPTFWYVTLRNLRAGAFGVDMARSRVAVALRDWHAPPLLAAYLVILALIAQHFWDYWSSLL